MALSASVLAPSSLRLRADFCTFRICRLKSQCQFDSAFKLSCVSGLYQVSRADGDALLGLTFI